jgi:glycosyltransferase involved in cell wall biosynthesis
MPSSPLRVIRPGAVSLDELGDHLAAADIFVAPFVDGVSMRRTTVVAALQHGLPVVGTRGHLTDPSLADEQGSLHLSPPAEPATLAANVAELVGDEGARRRAGGCARELYRRRFAWNVIAERLVRELGSAT